MTRILCLTLGFGLLFGLVGCDNVDITQMQQLLGASPPSGAFEGDWFLDSTSGVYFGESRMEEREDGTYIIPPAGALTNGAANLTFEDGSVLKGHVSMTWEQGAFQQKVVETDPDTGAPLKMITTATFPWDLHSETGHLLFLCTGVIQERHQTLEGGRIVFQEDIQPALLRGVGVGVYEGYVLKSDAHIVLETRNDVPGIAWYDPGVIEKAP